MEFEGQGWMKILLSDGILQKKAFPYSSGSKRCNILLTEKLLTDKVDPRALLNKRSEIVSKCRYRHKFTLKGFRWLFNPPKQLVLKLIKVL